MSWLGIVGTALVLAITTGMMIVAVSGYFDRKNLDDHHDDVE